MKALKAVALFLFWKIPQAVVLWVWNTAKTFGREAAAASIAAFVTLWVGYNCGGPRTGLEKIAESLATPAVVEIAEIDSVIADVDSLRAAVLRIEGLLGEGHDR